MIDFIWAHRIWNKGVNIIYEDSHLFAGIPPALSRCGHAAFFSELFKRVALFENLSDMVIADLCLHATKTILPPRAVVTHSGEICSEMHIIAEGKKLHCKYAN